MKKTIILIVIALLLALVVYGIASGRITRHGISLSSYTYDHADCYTAGDARISGRVAELNVNWISGGVCVEYYDGSDVRLAETSGGALAEDEALHWWLDGDTLYVKYAASGFRAMMKELNKELTILLPSTLEAEQLTIRVVSADVDVQVLSAEKVVVNAVSGDVHVAAQETGSISIDTVSGEVQVTAEQMQKLDVRTVSGGVRLRLPEELGFVAQTDTVSGSVGGDLPMQREGDDRFVSGDRQCRIDISTVSGDVLLDALD